MKTPKQLVKLFLGTTALVFFSVIAAVYIFSNTFLKHYMMRELAGLFPGKLSVGYLSSDLMSYVAVKGVTVAPVAGGLNTSAVSLGSLRLEGAILDAAMGRPGFSLNFSSLDITAVSDGKKIYLPSGLGIDFEKLGARGMSGFGGVRAVSFDSCNIVFSMRDPFTGAESKKIALRNFSGNIWPDPSRQGAFCVTSKFDYVDDLFKLDGISYSGALDPAKMVLSGNAHITEGLVSNRGGLSDYVRFAGRYSCNYDFTLFLSKLDGRSSDYLAGNADFKVTSGEVSFRTPVIGDTVIDSLAGMVTLDSSTMKLSFRDFDGRYGGVPVAVTGEVDLSAAKMDLSFSGNAVRLPSRSLDSAEAEVAGSVAITGLINAPVYRIRLTSPQVNYRDAVFGAAALNAVVDSESVEILEARAQAFGGEVSSVARMAIASGIVDATAKVKGISSKPLKRFLGAKLDGISDFEIKKGSFSASGKPGDAATYELSGTVEVAGCHVLSESLSVNGFSFGARNGELVFPGIRIVTPGSDHKNEIHGKYNLRNGEYSFTGKNLVFNPAGLPELKAAGPKLAGPVGVSFELSGGPGGKRSLDLIANLEKLSAGGAPLGFDTVRGKLAGSGGSGYHLEEMKLDDDIVVRRGKIGADGSFAADVDLYEVSVAQARRFAPGAFPAKMTGKITGKLYVSGNINSPGDIRTDAEIRSLGLKYENLSINNLSPVKFANHRTRIELSSFHMGVNGHSLSVEGFVDFKGSGEVGLKVKLDETDLKMLKMYAPAAIKEIAGTIDMEGVLKGELRNPSFDGSAKVSAKTVKFAGLNETVSELSLALESKNFDVKVTKGAFKLDKMAWEISGGAKINHGGAPLYLDLTMECKDIKHEIGKNSSFEGSSKLGLKGDVTKPRLYGSFKINKGKIELSPELFKVKREPLTVGPIELDVIIFADKNVWITNSFINAEINGKFTLKSAKANLVYTGEMNAVRGSATFNNREFKIIEGKVQFNENPMFDPLFKVKGETRVDVFKIELNISGSTSNPLFALSSQPPLTQPEITALLTTGQAQSTMNSKDAAAMPAKMYADYQKDQLLGGVKNKVKDALDLDDLSVKTGGTTEKGGRIEQSVSAGKYINDKLYVNYTESKEKDVDTKVKHYQFNYKLNRTTDLDVKDSNTEGSSVGVKVKKEF